MIAERLSIRCQRLAHGADLPLPAYASAGAAGLDLLAAIPEASPVTLKPMERNAIPTGLAIALPENYEAQVRPRSGLARKHGITLLNAPGTVDADYRGEIGVVLINLSNEEFVISRGMRIAQLVVAPVTTIQWQEEKSLDETERGKDGFGSTGV